MGYLLSLETITKAVKELKKSNKVVYTHGAYDLFHYGQSEFLRISKEQGQILIVGVEPDKAIEIYKGIRRPVIPLKERINILSKLNQVDFTFPIEYLPRISSRISTNNIHYYHLNLYHLIKPDVVTFGRLYSGMRTINEAKSKLKDIKFKEILHKYDFLQSTTKIIDKILSSQKN